MNPVLEFLQELRAKNINISAEGNQLVCEAPPGVLTLDLRERMSAFKPAILRLLGNPPLAEGNAALEGDGAPHTPGLSRAQRAIWLLEQINPGTSIWNVSWALDLRGQLDHRALNTALRMLMERQAALRSQFRNVAGNPMVEHTDLGDWRMHYCDLRGSHEAEAQAVALAKAEAQRPFNLEQGPLCRVLLWQTADAAYVLVVVVHHIVADGWSLGVMGRELSQLYQALAQGKPACLPSLRADYQTYVQYAKREEAATLADVDWWRQKLSGELPVISLAPDSTRVPSGAGRRLSIELGAELTRDINALARRQQATPFMVLLAAFKLLIHRYTGQTDLLVGVQTSGRERPEFADVVGMFVNTVVLRTTVSAQLTFADMLSRVRESSLESFARQHIAFDRIVEAVRPPRAAGHNPLVRQAFTYQNLPPVALRLGSVEVKHKPLELAGSRYELAIEIWRTARGLVCDFEYATDLFDDQTVSRLMGHYQRLLGGIVADPGRRIFELPLLTDAESEQMALWNNTRTDYRLNRRLDTLFAEQVAKTPDALALIHGGRELSYRELDHQANQLAHHLRALIVRSNVLVGICLERSPDLIVAILAVLKAGGAYVPLDPQYPRERLAFMLEDSAAPVLITQSSLVSLLPYSGHQVLLDKVKPVLAKLPYATPNSDATCDDLAYVIYTSGSTGRPKGTMLRHSAGFLIDWARRTFSPEELSRVVAATSICFDLSVFEIFVPLCTGGAVILVADPLDPPDPASRPTLLNTVPSALAELARVRAIPESVRTIIACGEKLTSPVVDSLYEAAQVKRVYNVYGPTEYTTYATAALTTRGAGRDPPIGRPLGNTQVYVLDPRQQMLPIGVVGELYIAGVGLACGYLGQPQLTAERFVNHPFGPSGSRMYRTGDLVRWTSAGELEFIGRADHQVKLRGFRVELGEIETMLRRHPAIRDAVVLVRQDRPDNARLVAYIVPNGEAPSAAVLHQHLTSWLPDYMVPSGFVVLAAVPLTPSGKINRTALPPPGLDQPAPVATPDWVQPLDEVIADTFKHVLQLDHFDATDNFFERGGHSLQVMAAAAQLEQLMAHPVSPAWIFQAPTPRELALLLEVTLTAPASHIVALQPQGARAPLFCLHDLFSRPLAYANLARILSPDQPVYGLVPGPLEAAIIADPRLDVLTPAYVNAIRNIQRHGPYRIVGYSFGGVPAFDVAQALLAENEDVLLIMIDPYIFGATPSLTETAKWVARRGRIALKDVWAAEQLPFPRIAGTARWTTRQAKRAIRQVRKGLNRRRMPREAIAASKVPVWVSPAGWPLAKSLLEAEAVYRYRPYWGSALFIQVNDRNTLLDFLNADGLNGWAGLFKGTLDRIEVPARHDWILRHPAVAEVAKVIRAL